MSDAKTYLTARFAELAARIGAAQVAIEKLERARRRAAQQQAALEGQAEVHQGQLRELLEQAVMLDESAPVMQAFEQQQATDA
jgi:hypothetical protein